MTHVSPQGWQIFLNQHPNAHLLQTRAWGELKSEFGWQVERLVAGESGAQVLFRSLPLGLSLAYLPRGPVGEDWDSLWPELDRLCKQRRAVFLKVEPDLERGESASLEADTPSPGFRLSPHPIQPPRTLTVDLRPDEEDILLEMKSKTRYNIRLAGRKDVVVEPSDEIDTFYEMLTTTGERADFGVHSRAYYRRAYELFAPPNACRLLIARYEGTPLAAIMVFAHGERAWYLYGASSNRERNRMPTYLLQWEAMRWAKERGCVEYDLWGVPDANRETLEDEFLDRHDGLWGVYRFKRGFGGELRRAVGPWDRVYRPGLYALYRLWMKR
jgi:lipid II:glycine glycyltransferase (peptidoglycan interpeptide bridge formation enzyme)